MNKILLGLSLYLLCLSNYVLAAEKAAKVILMRGKVTATKNGKDSALKKGMWVSEKTKISTSKKSFVKLLFIDKSSMNVGPKSSIVIDSFPKKKAGIITLLKGQLRSKVTKNYMEIQGKDKSKLFIKTPTAAMGIRGTDFQVNYNPQNRNTSLITFSGAVAMAQLPSNYNRNPASSVNIQTKLETIVSSPTAVIVKKGQISGVMPGRTKQAMKPVKMHPGQHEAMKHNDGTNMELKKAPKVKKQVRSIVPKGMAGKDFANKGSEFDKQMKTMMGDKAHVQIMDKVEVIKTKEIQKYEKFSNNSAATAPDQELSSTGNTKSYNGNGMMFNTESVGFIPPDQNAIVDSNTGTLGTDPRMGTYDPTTGSWKPTTYDMNAKGEFIPMADNPRSPSSTNSGLNNQQAKSNEQGAATNAPQDSTNQGEDSADNPAEANTSPGADGTGPALSGQELPPPRLQYNPTDLTPEYMAQAGNIYTSGNTQFVNSTGETMEEIVNQVQQETLQDISDTVIIENSNSNSTNVIIQINAE